MKTKFTYLFIILCISNVAIAIEGDPLTYDIPDNAHRIGPINTRDSHQKFFAYFRGGAKVSSDTLIGRETYYDQTLIMRELYRNGKRHGIQRQWYNNGRPELESQYNNGDMDGTFKVWDDRGHLVGQYIIVRGAGTAKTYDSKGRLIKEDNYQGNKRHGLRMLRLNGLISLTWSKDGHLIDKGYDFHENGELAVIAFFSSIGQPNGPLIEFSKAGVVTKKSWYLENREISESEYAFAASRNSSLPPYYSDAREYKKLVSEDARILLEKYRTMTSVKIPLEFDKEGNPILQRRDRV